MTDRERLAADLRKTHDDYWDDPQLPPWSEFYADRLIALGWTRHPLGTEDAIAQYQRMLAASEASADREITRLRALVGSLDEERLARAIDGYQLPPEANRPMSYVEARRYVAAAIAKAYREDTDATR